MSNANRPNRKASDEDIIRMNSVGLSLATIARELGVHQTTVAIRLQSLNIAPVDTRRSFMEDVLKTLTPSQQGWLVDQLGPHINIKDLVRNLIVKEYISKTNVKSTGEVNDKRSDPGTTE